jgi:hypothetical protein
LFHHSNHHILILIEVLSAARPATAKKVRVVRDTVINEERLKIKIIFVTLEESATDLEGAGSLLGDCLLLHEDPMRAPHIDWQRAGMNPSVVMKFGGGRKGLDLSDAD